MVTVVLDAVVCDCAGEQPLSAAAQASAAKIPMKVQVRACFIANVTISRGILIGFTKSIGTIFCTFVVAKASFLTGVISNNF